MKLKKCPKCDNYSLKEGCNKCEIKNKEAHYKYIKIKDAPKSNPDHFKK